MCELRSVLTSLEAEGAALGHLNVSDFVMLKAVFAPSVRMGFPVLVGVPEGEREFLGLRQVAAVVSSLREQFNAPIFLNADHAHSLARAVEAAKAGYDEIVSDFSELPFEENVSKTKEVVEAVKSINPAILAEGEIGDIGIGSEIHETAEGDFKRLTTAVEARQFVDSSGIDVLAPAVGNKHGMVESMVQGKTKKRLEIRRIAEIKKTSGVFLTLHGGSGTDDDDFREAIAAGINIIHVSTELRVARRPTLESSLAGWPNEVVPYKVLSPVVDSVEEVVAARLKLFCGNRNRRTESANVGVL